MGLSNRKKMDAQSLIILGTSGFAQEIHWLIQDINKVDDAPRFDVKGFIGEPNKPQEEKGMLILGNDDWAFAHLDRKIRFVTAVANPSLRRRIAESYERKGFQPISLIHPTARIAPSTPIPNGAIVCAGAILTTHIQLGRYPLINLHTTIGHDAQLGEFVTLAPGVHLSGGVVIGDEVELGTGAVVLPLKSIGAGARIGAGAVVTKDLLGGRTYMGVPAQFVPKDM